jgi:hypothetical protein
MSQAGFVSSPCYASYPFTPIANGDNNGASCYDGYGSPGYSTSSRALYEVADGTYLSSRNGAAKTTTLDGSVYAGDWLQFSLLFPNPVSFTPTSYAFKTLYGGGTPTTWALLGSNTGTTGSWSVLDSRPVSCCGGNNNFRSYVISPAMGAAFTTFRLIAMSVSAGSYFNLEQFRLVGTANGTVTSTLNTYALGFPISAYVSSLFPTSSTSVSITSATPSSSNGAVLVGPLPSILAQYTQLTNLQIANAGLLGTIPDIFGGMTLLTNLDLRSNGLTGSLPQSLMRLCLKAGVTCYLGGSNNFSTSNILPALPLNITSFAGLWGITLAAMPDLSSFTSLSSIAISSVGMTGTIPSWLGSLTALQTLDLSSNALAGTIPDIWGSLTNLKALSLSGNQLTGTLPPSLGSLLAVIQVDNNAGLNGSVPMSVLQNCAVAGALNLDCSFALTSLTLPLPGSSGSSGGSGSSFDPTSLQSTIASLTATIAAMNASHLATIAALQVNITAARTACSV